MGPDTLVVIPAVNGDYDHHLVSWRRPDVMVLMLSTAHGGYPTGAIKRAYHEYPQYEAYLFAQDSMEATQPDYMEAFWRDGITAWATFPLFFDTWEQENHVRTQYPGVDVDYGIFGPVFYATREAMARAEPFFPATPLNRLEAQGTERAWAFCFKAAGLEVVALYDFDPRERGGEGMPPLRKVYADRP